MTSERTFAGANALIVGASGALGSRIATSLGMAGAHLTLVGRREDALLAAAASVPAERVQRMVADLRDPSFIETAVADSARSTGTLDIVVNAMGVVAFGDVADLDTDVVEELFLTNTFGAIFLSKAALPVMNEGGTIASISGIIAERNMPGMAAYGASKAALLSFNEGFAREARRKKVRVLDVRPPHTETGLADRAIAGTAPKFPEGLNPDTVTETIVAALADPSVKDLPAKKFSLGSDPKSKG